MAKTYIDTVKYVVYANVRIKGTVDKSDIVGAIFGQTEGLLGEELDLRDLQKNGRIGRIEVEKAESDRGTTSAVIKIPSSLDKVETCIIAASLENVDRVGPYEAEITIDKVEDTRKVKRKAVVERAKELLRSLIKDELPESKEIVESVREDVKQAELTFYGPEKLPAGPGIERSDEIIVVEGRADVLNLLKNDINNVIALQGARAHKTIVDLTKKKETTLFLDGDRGGDIILKQLIEAGAEIDFVARAPVGKEVEELTRKELLKCLRAKIPFEQAIEKSKLLNGKGKRKHEHNGNTYDERGVEKKEDKSETQETKYKDKKKPKKMAKEELMEMLKKDFNELSGNLKARIYSESGELIDEVSVRHMIKALDKKDQIGAIVFDGIITQRLVDLASSKGAKVIVGTKKGNIKNIPDSTEVVIMVEG